MSEFLSLIRLILYGNGLSYNVSTVRVFKHYGYFKSALFIHERNSVLILAAVYKLFRTRNYACAALHIDIDVIRSENKRRFWFCRAVIVFHIGGFKSFHAECASVFSRKVKFKVIMSVKFLHFHTLLFFLLIF